MKLIHNYNRISKTEIDDFAGDSIGFLRGLLVLQKVDLDEILHLQTQLSDTVGKYNDNRAIFLEQEKMDEVDACFQLAFDASTEIAKAVTYQKRSIARLEGLVKALLSEKI